MTDNTASNSTTDLGLSLEAIHLPPTPDFWPLQWGWWTLLAGIIVTLLLIVFLFKWRKRRLRAKKAALALLQLEKQSITPSGAMEIVRQAVLSYYPRNRVANLSGQEWLSFLDSQVANPIFSDNEQEWLVSLYQKSANTDTEKLVSQCETWLITALPPKKGGRE
ncbi:DUF4381 domain-containing protein [Vibrio sp. TH_r3]|uniref:DUF4381 domain-containing protein n=1 Tax=Vibrio sp. TH_r3 TaxID=3082084 RepID=UPI0029554124|nr:DUF4381 domain-containing protein [Vibrio sp. TH_r3]MDV7103295.1 DUF4381 domain-containing protein [Vibrio sp. TH_r3]